MVDVIGVVDRVDAAATIQRRDGSDVTKRNVYIRDDSGKGVEVTFWGAYCAAPGDQLEEARRPPARIGLHNTLPCPVWCPALAAHGSRAGRAAHAGWVCGAERGPRGAGEAALRLPVYNLN
jgi:hypothetical protein